MRPWRLVYWFITGGLLGLGVTQFAGLSLGVSALPVGVILLVIGLFTTRGRELVAGVVGLGALPSLLLVYVIVSFPPPPDVAPFIYGGALLSSAITVVGLVTLVRLWRAKRSESRAAMT